MNRKLLSMMLALVLVLGLSGSAFAAVPSKTTQDMTTVGTLEVANAVEGADQVAITLPAESAAVVSELEKIVAFVNNEGNDVVSYFGDAAREEIAALLPEGANVDGMEMNEFAPLALENYSEEFGDITVGFTFATQYTVGQNLVAMVGVVNAEGTVDWSAMAAEAQEDGSVKVTFTQEALTSIQNGDAMIAILSEKAAA